MTGSKRIHANMHVECMGSESAEKPCKLQCSAVDLLPKRMQIFIPPGSIEALDMKWSMLSPVITVMLSPVLAY